MWVGFSCLEHVNVPSVCRGTAGAGVPGIYSVMGSSLPDNFCRTVSMHKVIFKSKRLFTIYKKKTTIA